MKFLLDLLVTIAVAVPCFAMTFALLWRLRNKGAWTLLLGFVVHIVLSAAYLFLLHGSPDTPAARGLSLGYCWAMLLMLVYHISRFANRSKRKTAGDTAPQAADRGGAT